MDELIDKDDIKFGILTPSLLHSLRVYGNTVISTARFEAALRAIDSDPLYSVKDRRLLPVDRREIYKDILLREIERLTGFDVTITLYCPASMHCKFVIDENNDNYLSYIIEKVEANDEPN